MATTTTLKALRLERGLSQRDLAQRLDVSAAYMSRMEDGEAPLRHVHARKAAVALKTSESHLVSAHEAEVDFFRLEGVLEAIKGAELAEILATPKGRRTVQEFVSRCVDLGGNDALSPALKSAAMDNAEAITLAVSKATQAAGELVALKRLEDRDAATKAADEDESDGRPHRDIYGRVRKNAKHARDSFGRARSSDDHVPNQRVVPSAKRSSVSRSSDVLPDVAETMRTLNRDIYGRAVKETEDGASGFSQRGRQSQREAEEKRQRERLEAESERATKSAARADKNFVKGSLDWVRREIEKQLDADASGQRQFMVRVVELFTDRAIVQNDADSTIREYPWSFSDGDETVTLGEPVEVELESEYEPIGGGEGS